MATIKIYAAIALPHFVVAMGWNGICMVRWMKQRAKPVHTPTTLDDGWKALDERRERTNQFEAAISFTGVITVLGILWPIAYPTGFGLFVASKLWPNRGWWWK